MSLQNVVAEHQRISILRALQESPRYSANDSLLKDQLAVFALEISRDQLRGQIAWLQEQGLVTVEHSSISNMQVVTLTERGADVAAGHAFVPGIKRPGPRA